MSNQYPPQPPQPPRGGGSARYLNTPPVGSGRPATPPKRTTGSKIGCIIGATVVVGLVLLIGVPVGTMVFRSIQEVKAFNPHFESYAAATEFPAIADDERGYLKTPVIAITIQDNGDTETFSKDPPCFDDLNSRSAFKKIKAEKPEQVRSVILMKWGQFQDG